MEELDFNQLSMTNDEEMSCNVDDEFNESSNEEGMSSWELQVAKLYLGE